MLSTRINSGAQKGKILVLPPQTVTRAVTAKVRASIFNKLEVDGVRVLDLYAGGGTLGFEALSCGASSVTFVDRADKSIEVLKKNAQSLGLTSKVSIKKSDVLKYCYNVGLKYDIVFLDPPYRQFNNTLVKTASNLVQLGGILVVSCSSRSNVESPEGTSQLSQKIYGDTKIVYIQKN
mgnify:CR=1 FL=1